MEENRNEMELVNIEDAEVETEFETRRRFELDGTSALIGGLITVAGIAAGKGAKKLWKKYKTKKEQKRLEAAANAKAVRDAEKVDSELEEALAEEN